MRSYNFDLIVIGAGSGGVRAARMAAALGKRVAIVERQYLGGTCVNVGCIPKKLLHYAAGYAESFHEAHGYGWTVIPPTFDWQTLIKKKDAEIARLNGIYRNMLLNAGVLLLEGEGYLCDAHTVTISNGRKISAERILIAVGAAPWKPAIPGIECALTSDDFFAIPTLPKSAVVVGGGYIAVELASILNGLGVDTRLIHRGDGLLRGFDEDIRQFLFAEMQKKGIDILLHKNVSRIDRAEEGYTIVDDHGGNHYAEQVIFATGRQPALESLGLENTAVQYHTSGHIQINDNYQTAEPSIYAIGDVVGRKELTPVATAEAMRLIDHLYSSNPGRPPLDYSMVASCVFSSPEVGTVGLSQQQAETEWGCADVAVFHSEFRALRHTLSGSQERTFMKLVVQKSTDRVVGMHMVGADAGEIVQGFAVALQMGATKAQLDMTIGIHPTAAEEFVTMRTASPKIHKST